MKNRFFSRAVAIFSAAMLVSMAGGGLSGCGAAKSGGDSSNFTPSNGSGSSGNNSGGTGGTTGGSSGGTTSSPYSGYYSGDVYGPSGEAVLFEISLSIASNGSVAGSLKETFTSVEWPPVAVSGTINSRGNLEISFANPVSGARVKWTGTVGPYSGYRLAGVLTDSRSGDEVIVVLD